MDNYNKGIINTAEELSTLDKNWSRVYQAETATAYFGAKVESGFSGFAGVGYIKMGNNGN